MLKDRLDLSKKEEAQWASLERLAISAGLIQSALSSAYPIPGEMLKCPYLAILPNKDIIPMAVVAASVRGGRKEEAPEAGVVGGVEHAQSLFELWPNKFGQLAFGFARDHLEFSAPQLLDRLASLAAETENKQLILGPFSFHIKPGEGFVKGCEPSRVSAPAHLALCKKMASTPGWIVAALERMERGESALDLASSISHAPSLHGEPLSPIFPPPHIQLEKVRIDPSLKNTDEQGSEIKNGFKSRGM